MITKAVRDDLQNKIVEKIDLCLQGISSWSASQSDKSCAEAIKALVESLDILDYADVEEEK